MSKGASVICVTAREGNLRGWSLGLAEIGPG
jgi:hypothetical protein